jgi:hypothetical protein
VGSGTLHVREQVFDDRVCGRTSGAQECLEVLIHLRGPVADALKRLRAFDWDGAPDLVTLSPATVIGALDRYLPGDVTAEEIEKWAQGIEVRDDLAFPPLFATVLKELFFELAHPEINRPLSKSPSPT